MRDRTKLGLVTAGFGGMAGGLGWLIFSALTSGEVSRMGRSSRVYSLELEPGSFWLQVALLGAGALASSVMFALSLWAFFEQPAQECRLDEWLARREADRRTDASADVD